MKKFRILSIALALLIILAMFAGCSIQLNIGETTPSSTDTQATTNTQPSDTVGTTESNIQADTSNKSYITTKDAFVDKMEQLLDLSLYTELDESDVGSSILCLYQIDEENEKEYDLDYKLQLGDGSEFTIPITFSELEKKGWILRETSDPDRELDSGYMTFGTIENASGKTLSVAAYNPTEEKIAFKECTVINVDSQQYGSFDPTKRLDDAIDFTVCDSLTNASTLEDIIQRLGNPYYITCALRFDDDGKYTDSSIEISYQQESSAYSQITFKLSGDGNYITALNYDVAPE